MAHYLTKCSEKARRGTQHSSGGKTQHTSGSKSGGSKKPKPAGRKKKKGMY